MTYPHCYGKMDWILKYPEDNTPRHFICDCNYVGNCLRITRNKECNKKDSKGLQSQKSQ